MPYYLQMYKSVEIMNEIEDPFGNVDITETYEETRSGQSSGSASSTNTGKADSTNTETGDSKHRFSNTPQGSLSNLEDYLTEASLDDQNRNSSSEANTSSSGTSSSESESSETVSHTFTKKGNQGVNTYAHDMIELRKTFLNVDMMIIEDLNELFLAVY